MLIFFAVGIIVGALCFSHTSNNWQDMNDAIICSLYGVLATVCLVGLLMNDLVLNSKVLLRFNLFFGKYLHILLKGAGHHS